MNHRQALTATPTALSGTAADTRYTIQNIARRTVFVETAATAPTNADTAFRLAPIGGGDSTAYFSLATGESLFVWSEDDGRGVDGAVVWTEEA